MNEYTENNNHRHLSHLYPAWPAYETQTDPALTRAAKIAIDNRDRLNTGDDTAGHGWMHKALVQARLKNGDGVLSSLLPMMRDAAYYSSLMTDHDSNRRCNCYCTDTLFGTVGAINEALLFSNTGEIEILPALPSDWLTGSIHGLMARTRAEVKTLTWNLPAKSVHLVLRSHRNENVIRLSAGLPWTEARINGDRADVLQDSRGKYIQITLSEGTEVTVAFEV